MNEAAKITDPDAAAGLLEMPDVNERAAGAEATPPAGPAVAEFPAGVDSLGRTFDPEKFRPDKDSTGRWKNLRCGRKPKAAPEAAPSPSAGSFVAPDTPPPPPPDPACENTETMLGLIQTALIMLGHEDGILTDLEKTMLRRPLQRVLKKYDVGEMPAELELAGALAAIIIERLQRPKVMGRIERLKLWLGGKVADYRGARVARKVEKAVQ